MLRVAAHLPRTGKMRHITNLVRMSLQHFRELAAPDPSFFPITHERFNFLGHAPDVEAEVVVDVLARQAVSEGGHVQAGVCVAFPL